VVGGRERDNDDQGSGGGARGCAGGDVWRWGCCRRAGQQISTGGGGGAQGRVRDWGALRGFIVGDIEEVGGGGG
jgi:hypothetical protein